MKENWLLRCSFWFFALVPTLGSPASPSSPYDDYLAQKSRIIANEFHTSLGGKLEFEGGERDANDVLMAAKREEVDRGYRDPHSFPPAQNFMTVIEEIRLSKTFQIIRRMPKGGALHVHDIAMVQSQFLYENMTFHKNLYICHTEDGSIEARFLRSPDNDTTCTSPAGWKLLADLRANASIADYINARLKKGLTPMTAPDTAATHHADVDGGWVPFDKPSFLQPLFTYVTVFVDNLYQGLKEFHDDNVMYLEIRSSLPSLYDLDGNVYGPHEVARIMRTTIQRFVADHPDFIGAKLIFSASKRSTKAQMDKHLVLVASLIKEFPEFVAGLDLVGEEDRRQPIFHYADQLRAISPKIPLFLHAGETKWNGITDENLIDAVLLNVTRIGHGFALPKHPRLMELVQERGIAIEVNPISNQILGFVADMRNHPASFLFARDFPVVVSSDDPGMWGAAGLSYDFYEAFVGIMSRSADIRALKQLAINSIKYSAMSEREKTRAYTMWKAKWTRFVRDVGVTTQIELGNISRISDFPAVQNYASSTTCHINILHLTTLLVLRVLLR